MKYLSICFLTALAALLFHSCKKDETKVVMNSNKPVLSSNSNGPLVLLKANEDQQAVTFNWSDVDYGFNDALKYTLQISKTDDFKQLAELSVVKANLTAPLSVKTLNGELLKIAAPGQPQSFSFRLKSDVGKVVSNTLKIIITPYLDLRYPLPATLFIVGSATPGGWTNPVPDGQEFKLDAEKGVFTLTVKLTHDDSYLFLPVKGQWAKYGFDGDGNKNSLMGDNFRPEGGDIKAPAETGIYEIKVDFVTGKFSLTKQ
ncbi:MAG: SusE domain-containing protein [Niabella sp.]|nr:SusE domain-containing protein [Niabella sp.]